MIKLSERLKSIADFIDNNSNIIDIGCDHGLLDIYLVQSKENIKIIASDINNNALANTIKNIKKHKLENTIKVIQSNGLNNIDTTNMDTIVIAGMGAHTITGILYNNLNKLKNINTIVLQSNNDIDFLRKKIVSIGYYIEKENLIKEKNIIYTIIKFKKGHKHYTRKELYFGPILIKENSKLFQEKKELEYNKLKQIYKLIPKNHIHHRIKTLLKIRLYKN